MKSMSHAASRPPTPSAPFEVLRAYFSKKPEVWAAYLFGSASSETSGPTSDIDVAVLREPLSDRMMAWEARSRYAADLEQRLRRPVDVVLLQEAGDTLSEAILREGTVVHEGNPDRHRAFCASRILRLLDFLPTRELTERGLGRALRGIARGP